jgi:hypothetical protein
MTAQPMCSFTLAPFRYVSDIILDISRYVNVPFAERKLLTLIKNSGYRTLEENQRVSFTSSQGPKGPQAENVQVSRT